VIRQRRPDEPAAFAAAVRDQRTLLDDTKGAGTPGVDRFPPLWGAFRKSFEDAQGEGKCGFCEVRYRAGVPGDVEHFRPKSFVQARSAKPAYDDRVVESPKRKNVGVQESGYWWLAYAWTNYLASCKRCNSTWKGNQFPVDGARATVPGSERGEQHLLLNPYDDTPEPHFEFEPLTGQVRGTTPRGKATVQVCGLDRKTLDVDRLVTAKRVRAGLDALAIAVVAADAGFIAACAEVVRLDCATDAPFAAIARWMVRADARLPAVLRRALAP